MLSISYLANDSPGTNTICHTEYDYVRSVAKDVIGSSQHLLRDGVRVTKVVHGSTIAAAFIFLRLQKRQKL